MHGSKVIPKRRFQLVLIKPSHYGDDGYVIRWWRSRIPSNSLASIYGIAVDSAARAVLGADVDIDIEAVDELIPGSIFLSCCRNSRETKISALWP
jgi:hypothetical protein